MSDLLLMASLGLPRTGLVALYDPYRDAYGLTPEQRALLQTAKDYSGRGNTLTYGATTGASTDDPTNTGTAWSFDGGDFMLCPATLDTFTLITVAKQGTKGATRALWGFGKSGDTTNWMMCGFTADGSLTFYGKVAEATKTGTQAAATTSDYRMIAVTHSAGSWNLYQLPSLTPLALTAALTMTGQTLAIGCTQIGANKYDFFNGGMAFIPAWNRVLPSSELMRSYYTTKSLMASRGVTVA